MWHSGWVRGAGIAVTMAAIAGLAAGAVAKDKGDSSESKSGRAGSTQDAEKTGFVTGKIEVDMLLGKWCGNLGNYFFTEKKLNVTRHEDGKKYFYNIEKLNFGEGWIEVVFDKAGNNNTVFYEFTKDGRTMQQAANTGGDNGPKMKFRRS